MSATEPRLMVLLNPGRTSRHYMLGIAAAAKRLGIPHLKVDLTPIWEHLDRANESIARVRENVHAQFMNIVQGEGITHVIGYAQTGTGDLGLVRADDGGVSTIFAAMGLRHIMLWTDHPDWLLDGRSLDEPARTILANPRHTHVLKSHAAAEEAASALRWPNVHAASVGEDFDSLGPPPHATPVHDVVAIIGGCEALPVELLPFLEQEDPDPAAMDRLRMPAALERLDSVLARHSPHSPQRGACRVLAGAWLAAKIASPLDSLWRLSKRLRPEHGPTLDWLLESPRRWYDTTSALRTMVSWRRSFYLAWLSQRVNVGLYGASAAALGVPQVGGAEKWVEYAEQPTVYAKGRIALNINAAWDEEGLSHKPFQIAASQIPCVHHVTRELSEAFEIGKEVVVFDRPAGLLQAVRELLGDSTRRLHLGRSMRLRGRREHGWEAFLTRVLALA